MNPPIVATSADKALDHSNSGASRMVRATYPIFGQFTGERRHSRNLPTPQHIVLSPVQSIHVTRYLDAGASPPDRR